MGTLLKKHPDAVLAVLASVFIVLVIGGIGWVVTVLAQETAEVVAVSGAALPGSSAFDLADAAKLNLRGLVSSSSVSVAAVSSTPASTAIVATGTVSSSPVSVPSTTATATGN